MAFMYDVVREFRKYWGGETIIVYVALDDGTSSMWSMTGPYDFDITAPGSQIKIHDDHGFLDFETNGKSDHTFDSMLPYIPRVIEQINEQFHVMRGAEQLAAYIRFRHRK